MTEDNLRYYKGNQKVRRISTISPMRTAHYQVLEKGELGEYGDLHILPVRLCWRKKKEAA